jgi:predicted nucleotidyltransferase
MARKNYREYLQGERVRLKKYLYVLRPLMAALWVEQQRGPVPMRFLDLVEAMVSDTALRAAIDALLVIKRRAGEAEEGAAIPEINRFIELELQRLEHVPTPQKAERGEYSVLDRLLRDVVMQGQ